MARSRGWAARIVLAMLCVRALVPAGFMVVPVDGLIAVVLCDSDASGAMYRGGHVHPGHHHGQIDPTCPYAQSTGPAPLPTLPVLPGAPLATVSVVAAEAAQNHSHFGPVREQRPRAPPIPA